MLIHVFRLQVTGALPQLCSFTSNLFIMEVAIDNRFIIAVCHVKRENVHK